MNAAAAVVVVVMVGVAFCRTRSSLVMFVWLTICLFVYSVFYANIGVIGAFCIQKTSDLLTNIQFNSIYLCDIKSSISNTGYSLIRLKIQNQMKQPHKDRMGKTKKTKQL